MIFVWDTNVLALALYPGARDHRLVSNAADRVKFMLEGVSSNKDVVIMNTTGTKFPLESGITG